MVFKKFCILVLWRKVALALEVIVVMQDIKQSVAVP